MGAMNYDELSHTHSRNDHSSVPRITPYTLARRGFIGLAPRQT